MATKTKFVTAAMARNNWPGDFKRSVFEWKEDKKSGKPVRGKMLETLVFSPGVPVQLTAEQFEAVKGDIGNALVEVEFDEKNRPRVIDPAAEQAAAGANAELEATIQGQQAVIDEQSAALKSQQEAIDLLCQQVKDLGAVPIVDVEDESGSKADETKKTE